MIDSMEAAMAEEARTHERANHEIVAQRFKSDGILKRGRV